VGTTGDVIVKGAAGKIVVTCKSDTDGAVLVEIRDNGPGLSRLQVAKVAEGLGFKLVQAMAKQIGGTAAYLSSDKGLTVSLTLPNANLVAGGMQGLTAR
ncbi:MAG: ATP-binding protein, partial [Deltaproteobacteria bacterium]